MKEGAVRIQGNRLLVTSAEDNLSDAERKTMRNIVELYENAAYASPRPGDLPDLTGAPETDVNQALEQLYNSGRLIRLSTNVVLSADHFRDAQDLVVRTIQNEGVLDSADFKYKIASTRKYALAILDFLDSRHVTVRIGNNRKLARNHEQHLV